VEEEVGSEVEKDEEEIGRWGGGECGSRRGWEWGAIVRMVM
jgi:hypothetical protein